MTSLDGNDFRLPLRARTRVSLPPWAGGAAASVTVVIAVEPPANACDLAYVGSGRSLARGEDQN